MQRVKQQLAKSAGRDLCNKNSSSRFEKMS
jgi:hypothetical protein